MELGAEAHLFVGAASYTLNLDLSKRAIESGRHWVDLGGNTKVVEEILKLGEVAKEKRVCLVPDTGLQPGLGNIVAGEINKWLVGAQKIKIIVGGLPVFPEGELKYREVFSIEGSQKWTLVLPSEGMEKQRKWNHFPKSKKYPGREWKDWRHSTHPGVLLL